jgi:hypothetical protein
MPRSTTSLAAATFGAAAVGLAAPAVGAAATVTVDRACYSHVIAGPSTPVIASVTGGTPGAPFQVIATVPGKGEGSAGSRSGTFDGAGNGVVSIENVTVPGGTIEPSAGRKIDISVKDFGNGVLAPGPSPRVTDIAVSINSSPRNIRLRRTVKVSGSLASAGQRLYGFIVKGTSRHVLRRVALGKANVCGYASHRVVVAPKNYHTGEYRMYINAGKTLSKRSAIYTKFRIFRRYF